MILVACGRRDDADLPPDTAAMAPAPTTMTGSVSVIELGKHVGPDSRVTESATTFSPRDTIYVAVVTENTSPSSTLSARWTFQDGQVVDSTSQTIAPSATGGTTSVTTFHVVKPDGWPVGTYNVEIRLDGNVVGTRQITVAQ
jgi:hypothetical protein